MTATRTPAAHHAVAAEPECASRAPTTAVPADGTEAAVRAPAVGLRPVPSATYQEEMAAYMEHPPGSLLEDADGVVWFRGDLGWYLDDDESSQPTTHPQWKEPLTVMREGWGVE